MQGEGKVMIGCDAGQVVAGNAVTHIEKYVSTTSHGPFAVAFFSALSASAWPALPH